MEISNRTRFVVGPVIAAVTLMAASMSVFAAVDSSETASYGYLKGQQENSGRHGMYQSIAGLATDAEREAFYEANGIGDGAYGDAQYLDVEALVEAGAVSQETAEKIKSYASGKHDRLHSWYEGKADGMSPEQRHEFYDRSSDGWPGGSAAELAADGILTQEEADAIDAYLSGVS